MEAKEISVLTQVMTMLWREQKWTLAGANAAQTWSTGGQAHKYSCNEFRYL